MLVNIQLFLKIILIGVGATIILDLWALFLNKFFRIPITNWAMVGRWLGHIPKGELVQKQLNKAPSLDYELGLGWLAHYLIGISYILVLIAFEGKAWLSQPTVFPPLVISWFLLIAPFFIMMPCMGAGVAGANTPSPIKTRLISIAGHTVFGLGIYGSAVILNLLIS
ncbi:MULTISPECIES: DUF2938 domain-containing protein [Acinetobacter]|uniref:DUF2938 domain-containing protein n=2 Tax=Acinetobacter TaxID=469 RepID=N8YD03_9GAMM|nr:MULTISPECIES: DUF2938 domain-containing protein [Acinetobacter]ENV34637.1 hypothetical protein F960_01376 [Acinetobacter gerneri DSM 14967 = CIP 107464 = MTCC 9824]MBI1450718.1 DUF2938 domain-containing protein [Acinetobacter sp. FL51]RZG72603.1 DUF2938 domain-containing protein [Acinetobacter wuhouensis]SPL70005.1 hypothetical protein KPC_1183 [Acinetobacter stercoris]